MSTIPYGRHARRHTPLLVAARHGLLWLLPAQPRGHDSWHAVACAVGDLAEDFFSLLAITGAIAATLATGLIFWWLSPWLLAGVLAAGVLALMRWRLHRAVRRLEDILDEEDQR